MKSEPLPRPIGLSARTFVKGRKRHHGMLEQREQEWQNAIEWLRREIIKYREQLGDCSKVYEKGIDEGLCEAENLLDEAFPEPE